MPCPAFKPPHSLSESPGDSSTSAFHAFARAEHAHRQLMARKIAEQGVSPAQMFCLREVAHNPGITQRDLAAKLNVARPTLTVMLHKMEKAGLVQRRDDEADQRFTRIYLCEGGESAHERMHEVIGEIVHETLGSMSENDRAELQRLLGMLTENIEAALEGQEE